MGIWLGDIEKGDSSIYIAFAPAMKVRQLWKTYTDVDHVSESFSCTDGLPRTVMFTAYAARKIQKLWQEDDRGRGGLCQKLQLVAQEYPGSRFIFTGTSHGAVIAQMAALKFK